MEQFVGSFCITLFHSLWQAGLLWLVYIVACSILKNQLSPTQKKNYIYLLLSLQILSSVATFFIYFLCIPNNSTQNIFLQNIYYLQSFANTKGVSTGLFIAYAMVLIFKILKALLQWYFFKIRYENGLQKPTIELKLFTHIQAVHFGIKQKVQLFFSSTMPVPITFGFLKPIIILPIALVNTISLQQAESLILHELAHIKANDYLFNWFIFMSQSLFFFNPFIHILCSTIRLEREKYCDSTVIAFNYSPLHYAQALLQAQKNRPYILSFSVGAVAGNKHLLQRIKFFTNPKNFIYKKNYGLVPFIFLSVLFFTAVLFFEYSLKTGKEIINGSISKSFSVAATEKGNTTTKTKAVPVLNSKKEQPVIFKKSFKNSSAQVKRLQNNAEKFLPYSPDNIVSTVAFNPNNITKQIAIQEEQSGSKNIITKIYTVSFINNHWIITPEWMLKAKEINADSLNYKTDSSLTAQY